MINICSFFHNVSKIVPILSRHDVLMAPGSFGRIHLSSIMTWQKRESQIFNEQ